MPPVTARPPILPTDRYWACNKWFVLYYGERTFTELILFEQTEWLALIANHTVHYNTVNLLTTKRNSELLDTEAITNNCLCEKSDDLPQRRHDFDLPQIKSEHLKSVFDHILNKMWYCVVLCDCRVLYLFALLRVLVGSLATRTADNEISALIKHY